MSSVPIFPNNIPDYSDGDSNVFANKTIELSDMFQ